MHFHYWNALSPRGERFARWAGWLATALLLYTVSGFFILPPVVRAVALKQLSKQLDRPVAIREVRLNPFRLSASIRGLLVNDQDGAPLASWDEAYARFEFTSLFRHAWEFEEVSLSQPFVRVQINRDYRLNLSDMVARLSPATSSKSAKTGPHRAWRIARLRLTGARASFADHTTRVPFQRTIGPVEATVLDLTTSGTNQTRFACSGAADAGEPFTSQGVFCLEPFRSAGGRRSKGSRVYVRLQ